MDYLKDSPRLPSGAVAKIINVHRDVLRSFRNDGLLKAFGQEEGGRWTFDLGDVVGLWVGFKLVNEARVRERSRGFTFGRLIAPDLTAAVRGGTWVRWHAFAYTDDGIGAGWETWKGDSLDGLPAVRGFLVADNLLDVEALAALVPADVRKAVTA